ncbi:Ubiquitin-conjugating enzyme E2 Z [Halotydeus destructor]|nr:Ubiquitin-conjugating enzyme E2 Z [Halotydeus destructor]
MPEVEWSGEESDSDEDYSFAAFGGFKMGAGMSSGMGLWDPFAVQSTGLAPDKRALDRIARDLRVFHDDPVEGIYAEIDESFVTRAHALVFGPKGTPYEGGFFYFVIGYPYDYPIKSPKVKLMTTGGGAVRFNPNLYACGKVCLSILGTWPGPSWTPVYDLKAVLLSIQSLMCEEPYFNEPGYDRKGKSSQKGSPSWKYNQGVRYNTLKVAALDMYERINGDTQHMPDSFRTIVEQEFRKNLNFYDQSVEKELNCEKSNTMGYKILKTRLKIIQDRLHNLPIPGPSTVAVTANVTNEVPIEVTLSDDDESNSGNTLPMSASNCPEEDDDDILIIE